MDFEKIINVAQKKHGSSTKNEVQYYKAKFAPPKKEQRSKQLSANIKKYLAGVEEEKRQKALEERTKREELFALRSQDKKATKRIQTMLKTTKSANKSVLQDAVNDVNTAITMGGDTAQPDEDDYGYVSQEASAFYNKMMAKYSSTPDDPKFSMGKRNTNTNLSGTKDRVRAALEKEKADALLPHKRQRRPKEGGGGGGGVGGGGGADEYFCEAETTVKQEAKKSKPKVVLPPPIDFNSLLKLAQTKQFEPIKIEPKKKEEEGPLMTKKQRREFEKEQAWRERRLKGLPPLASVPAPAPSSTPFPKANDGAGKPSTSAKPTTDVKKPSSIGAKASQISKTDRPPNVPYRTPPERKLPPPPAVQQDNQSRTTKKPTSALDRNVKQRPSDNRMFRRDDATMMRKEQLLMKERQQSSSSSSRLGNEKLADRSRQLPPADVERKGKQFPAADVRRMGAIPAAAGGGCRPRQFPPPDVRRFPPQDVKRKRPPAGHKRRILDDDDDEYDSEMDDFIDDGPEGAEDYSKYISEIFRYDKNKYRHVEDDDDNMESSFSQQMREEFISTKIGIMEDLEDMKNEEIEKKMKAKSKKIKQF